MLGSARVAANLVASIAGAQLHGDSKSLGQTFCEILIVILKEY
jgi:hypothetical protein